MELLNPAREREFANDKMHIVDVKARDTTSRMFQVEIQMLRKRDLRYRMIYCWSDLYAKQVVSGDHYDKLQPAYSIWLVNSVVTPHDPLPIHRYKLRDESNQTLVEHGGIWVIELNKCKVGDVANEQQRWLKLFVEGDTLNDVNLPEWMHTPEMRKAMTVLHNFSEKEENYHIYASRLDYQRVQWTLENDALESKADAEKARQEAELAKRKATQAQRKAALVVQQLQAAQEEIARLKSAQR
ncbi:MAG: Rpn family recombination-promoting nuclease/putative transposase [Alphaproteobacteria bacterium]|nr:Rpn family recombination-promoting nuclease/putative transposase [Alphaproteobacteria bacterium]